MNIDDLIPSNNMIKFDNFIGLDAIEDSDKDAVKDNSLSPLKRMTKKKTINTNRKSHK